MGWQKQPMICCICGKHFQSDMNYCGGFVCGQECKKEFEWRKTLSIMNLPYEPQNK